MKLAKSGTEGEKVFLLLESGSRLHTVQVIRDKPDAPSNFTLKLRKHLRTRRLEGVRQLGVDRVVDFTFGAGDTAYHLILEMFAQVRMGGRERGGGGEEGREGGGGEREGEGGRVIGGRGL